MHADTLATIASMRRFRHSFEIANRCVKMPPTRTPKKPKRAANMDQAYKGQPSYPASRAIRAALINFPAVVRVIPVQPRFAPGRADRRTQVGADGQEQPSRRSRPARTNLCRAWAADRAAHGVTPALAGIGPSHHAHNPVTAAHPSRPGLEGEPRVTATVTATAATNG